MMDAAELTAGSRAFQEHEGRDAMYKTATFLVRHYWGRAPEMADSLGVLLLTWNQAFYRYGQPDLGVLEQCIVRNQDVLDAFRGRGILTYTPADDATITGLYDEFLSALRIAEGKCQGRRSPVAVAKALHLLAPAFFPLWDDKIAKAYGCWYEYIPFLRKMVDLARLVGPGLALIDPGKTVLKVIDEYNYAKYTKGWV